MKVYTRSGPVAIMTGKTHYAGALRIRKGGKVTMISAGYAACCSGLRTIKIRMGGNITYNPQKVTCKVCRARMAASEKAAA